MSIESVVMGVILAMLAVVLWLLADLSWQIKRLSDHVDVVHEDVCEVIDKLGKPDGQRNGRLSQYLDSMERKE